MLAHSFQMYSSFHSIRIVEVEVNVEPDRHNRQTNLDCYQEIIFHLLKPFDLILVLISFNKSSTIQIQIENVYLDDVLGIQIRGSMMVGADRSTELWRPPL